MSTELSPQQKFEQKIIERLRADIGELMDDEMLSRLVNVAAERMFFDDIEERSSYGSLTGKKTSWFKQEVSKLLAEKLKAAAEAWMKDNPDKVQDTIKEAIGNNAAQMLGNAISQMVSSQFYALQESLVQRLAR